MSAPNKYHEALNMGTRAVKEDIERRLRAGVKETHPTITYRRECMVKLAELQDVLLKLGQLKQSLSEIDLEGK